MKPQVKILGYTVQGHDEFFGTFVTGLERTENQAKKTLAGMLAHTYYTDKEKKTLKVVRVSEVTEEI